MEKEYKVIVKKVGKDSYTQTLTSEKIRSITSHNGKLSGLSDSIGITGTRIILMVDDIGLNEPENIAIIRNGKIINMLHGNVVFIAVNTYGEDDSLTQHEIKLVNKLIFNGKEVSFTIDGKYVRIPYLEF